MKPITCMFLLDIKIIIIFFFTFFDEKPRKVTMIFKLGRLTAVLAIFLLCENADSFGVNSNLPRIGRADVKSARGSSLTTTSLFSSETATSEKEESIWESLANFFYSESDLLNDIEQTRSFTNTVSLLRVGIPSFFFAASAKIAYPFVALALANAIDDSGVFAVVSQDASQYIRNILTTSGLTFSILVGQTYYFMYQVRKHKATHRESMFTKVL